MSKAKVLRLWLILGMTLILALGSGDVLASTSSSGGQVASAAGVAVDCASPDSGCDEVAEILVKFKAGADAPAITEVHRRNGGRVLETIPEIGVQVVEVSACDVADSLASYNGDPLIEYAEPNSAVGVAALPEYIPSDSLFDSQWNLERIGAPAAWGVTRSSPQVVVAVLDTGIDRDHPDLASKIVASHNLTSSSTVDDVYGHGTKVAGVAAAVTDNGKGVAGVGFDCSLMNVKVMTDGGYGFASTVVNGILWATNGPDGDPRTDDGADVINMSLVFGIPMRSLQDAVTYAWEHGVVLVAAAGNYGSDDPYYPARYPECIAVAATSTSADNHLLSFSTRGDWVDVGAPGAALWTTWKGGGYGYGLGSSLASPHVAGIAALLLTRVVDVNGNGCLNDEVRYAIESTCADIGPDVVYGMVHAGRAVSAVIPSLGFISGFVGDAETGAPISPTSGASITDGSREAFTNVGGGYTIYCVPAGTYTVSVSALGYTGKSQTVTVLPGKTSTANFSLARPLPGTISGVVRDSSTYFPIGGATVTDGARKAFTAADGSYTIDNVPEGSYTVAASASGYLSTTTGVTVYSGGTTVRNFRLSPDPSSGPKADFWATPVAGEKPLTVVFTDASASGDGIVSWLWSFGDGSTSTQRNPTHVYYLEGVFSVSLTIREADGDRDTKTRIGYVTVSANTAPIAGFSATPLAGERPLTVVFKDASESADGIVSWLWSFGDGSTSTAENPTHVYDVQGVYTVSLTVREADGDSDNVTRIGFITVSDSGPSAGFQATPVSGNEPLTVVFKDVSASADGIVSWLWSFGDGSMSTSQNPTHVYDIQGVYTVSLTVREADGDSSVSTKTGYIAVSDTSPTAGFSARNLGGEDALSVVFTDTSTSYDGIVSWLWDFGDGSTGAVQSPVHTYAEAGVYTVMLTVTDSDGSRDTVSHQIVLQTESGTVVQVRQGGTPLEGYWVYAYRDGLVYAGSQPTDSSGEVRFDLPEGSYSFRVCYNRTYWWSEPVNAPGYALIDIPAATEVTVTAGGLPVAGYRVYAYTPDGVYARRSAVTDASGRAVFILPEGDYKFRVYYDYTTWWSEVIGAPGSAVMDIG